VRGASEDGVAAVVRDPVAFRLRYAPAMHSLPPSRGEALHLRRAGEDEFIVEPLRLPRYTGDVGGVLPIQAAHELTALRRRFPNLQPAAEGKTRVNRVAGYTVVFRADPSRRLYGRLVLLPRPTPGTREGVKLLMLATPAGGVTKPQNVGGGGLKLPYRSFRFGTDGG
jgi:hypothetical protein